MDNHRRILHIRIRLSYIFQFSIKKSPSGQKQQKINITIESFTLELVQVQNFSLN